MELLQNKENFVIRNGENALWCSRSNGSLTARRATNIHSSGLECLGIVHGVIGKLKISQDSSWRLLLVKNCLPVGTLPRGQNVFKIVKVLVLTLSSCSVKDLDIELCPEHNPSTGDQCSGGTAAQRKPLQRTWNQFKQAAENIKPKKLGFKIPPLSDLVVTSGQPQKETKEKEKFERKVLEELVKMFNDSESFYYCPDGDITNCIQRQQSLDPLTPFWQRADDRFFWNKYMLQDLINSKSELCRPWLIPIIQGYVQINSCKISFDDEFDANSSHENPQTDIYNLNFKLCLISRRSRHRAGTRYKRRGVDEEGNTANYVETEQILEFANHIVSFVQVRGSVPLFWGQTGIKYKPPPRIYRDEEQNHRAFCRHFEEQLGIYKTVAAISLVNQLGKEKVIYDCFLRHVITYNNPMLTYVTFDFHEYCRGMRFENVSILTENIMDVIQSMGYCWVDQSGTICEQKGVFRVNCIDCLDRTNIVQSALARIVLEIQCRKLGLLSPERPLPPDYRTVYQQMWANNGDIISCQYAGTVALKGDYTRTGERRFAGMMKDGMNSANRYYISRVKDVYRQAIVDLMLGNPVEEFERLDAPEESEVLVEKEENLKTLIDECKKMLIQEPDECLGGWGLINCDDLVGDVDPAQQDMDIILLLSQKAYYVAHYDDDTDHVTSYQKIALDDLDKIEIGVMSFGSKHSQMCIRIFYRYRADAGYFHTFCTTSTRLFNNIVVGIHNQEEARESLRAVSETFVAAKKLVNQGLCIEDKKLDRQKSSKEHLNTIDIASEAQVQVESSVRPKASMSRENTSENLSRAHETTVAKLIHLTENQSAKLSTFGRAMAGMLPVRRMRFNSLQPKVMQMLPRVMYRKEDGTAESEVKVVPVIVERSAADGATETVSRMEVSTPSDAGNGQVVDAVDGRDEKKNLQIYSDLLSSSDSDLSLSEMNLLSKGHPAHVVLPSVGILMVTRHQVLVARMTQQVANDNLGGKGKTGVVDNVPSGGNVNVLLEQKKASLLDQTKSRSLDVEELASRTKDGKNSNTRSDVHKELLRKKLVAEDFDKKGCFEMLLKPTEFSGDNHADESQVGKIPDVDDHSTGYPLIVISDQEVVRPQPLLRRHSLLKISYSEGSLSNSLSASEENVPIGIDLDELDFYDPQAPGGSALNKLRVRVANLALPAMGMPDNRQKQLREQARSNRQHSQLRFKGMKTRILLL